MRFEDFNKELEKDIEQFKRQYLTGHKRDSNNYPLEMAEEDWYDQFLTWVEDNA